MSESNQFTENDFDIRCQHCDVTTEFGANYCPHCGTELSSESGEAVNLSGKLVDAVGAANRSSRGKHIPFGYFGGKYKHLNWLLPLLPQRKAYLEPFCGSAVVLLNREHSDVETINDLNGDVVNFFKVLREQPEELVYEISLTPYAESEVELAENRNGNVTDLERARRFFVGINQSYNSLPERWNWSYNLAHSSRGVPKGVSAYQAKISRLEPIAERLTSVQITQRNAIGSIQTFDHSDALIYADPPYPMESRDGTVAYDDEMSRDEHRELAEVLAGCDAEVAVSSYKCELNEEIYRDRDGWHRIDGDTKQTTASSTPGKGTSREVTEALYVNYEPTSEMLKEAGVFDS
jgi:DNA adenine methylase